MDFSVDLHQSPEWCRESSSGLNSGYTALLERWAPSPCGNKDFRGFPIFSKYQIPDFLKVFRPKFHFFVCQIPGTFTQILVIKILKCVKISISVSAKFPLLLWHNISYILQVISRKKQWNQRSFCLRICVCVDNVDMTN